MAKETITLPDDFIMEAVMLEADRQAEIVASLMLILSEASNTETMVFTQMASEHLERMSAEIDERVEDLMGEWENGLQ